jgi:1-acyl-sn-glycerol-3-phosphate acyltransferase
MLYRALTTILHALLRVLFTLEYSGRENVPEGGPVVIAGNHPSYLDPLLIGAGLERRVFFMAWDQLFRVPVLGALLRAFGAFPVRLGTKDPNAFLAALHVLESGRVLGIFPEAGRTKLGPMNPLKTGAARLAIESGAAIVPVTITGAFDAWPSSRTLPVLRKITVKYHPPIRLDPAELAARRDERAYHEEITERIRRTIERRLLPSLDADERKNRVFSAPASPVRGYELSPILAAFAGVALGGPAWLVWLGLAHMAYLLADIWWVPQRRITKALRDLVTPAAAFWMGPELARVARLGVPEWTTLAAVALGIGFAYNWANYYKAQRFARGALVAYFVAFALGIGVPYAYAPHLAFAAFAAVYSAAWRPLFWPFCASAAAAYAAGLLWATGGAALRAAAAHAALGALVALYVRLVKFSAHDGRAV